MVEKKNIKILLVDNMANARKASRNMLKLLGYRDISEATDGDVALSRLKATQFDFVIAELYMPRVPGLELLRQIREEPSLRDMPFLIITSETDTGYIAQAAEEDVDGYIIKPFIADTLDSKILSILERKANPPEAEVHLKLGNAYKDRGLYEKALEEFNAARILKPNSARVSHAMGELYEAMGDLTKAEELYREAAAFNPRYIKVHHSMSELYHKLGNEDEEINALKNAAAISPNNSRRQLTLGKLYIKKGMKEEADRAFLQATKSDPKNADLQTQIGEIYLEHGMEEKAADSFRGSLGLNESVHVYNRLGIALRRRKRYKEAVEEYKKALMLDPKDEVLYYNLGRAYMEDGQRALALDAFRKALELNPEFDETKKMLKELASPLVW